MNLFTSDWFWTLDAQLRARGLDSDAQTFDEIRKNLENREIYSPDVFASHCVYVILAGGFSQKTAKKIHGKIMDFLNAHGADTDALLKLFNNKNKINAVCKIWENRESIRDAYYKIDGTENRIKYLGTLPHIGKITANHLARNLGEDVVKYDIWIQRLGIVYVRNSALDAKINNGKLDTDVKSACDNMFMHLCKETGLPRGYIDVVLWKGCQNGLISV